MATEVSCSQYIDCRNGVGHVLSCGAGAVFDEVRGCVHPDETDRSELIFFFIQVINSIFS